MKKSYFVHFVPLALLFSFWSFSVRAQENITITYEGDVDMGLWDEPIHILLSTNGVRVRLEFDMRVMGVKQHVTHIVDLQTREGIMIYKSFGMSGYHRLIDDDFPELLYTENEFPPEQVKCIDSTRSILNYACKLCFVQVPEMPEAQKVWYSPDVLLFATVSGGPGSALGGFPMAFFAPEWGAELEAVEIVYDSLGDDAFSLEPPPGYVDLSESPDDDDW